MHEVPYCRAVTRRPVNAGDRERPTGLVGRDEPAPRVRRVCHLQSGAQFGIRANRIEVPQGDSADKASDSRIAQRPRTSPWFRAYGLVGKIGELSWTTRSGLGA